MKNSSPFRAKAQAYALSLLLIFCINSCKKEPELVANGETSTGFHEPVPSQHLSKTISLKTFLDSTKFVASGNLNNLMNKTLDSDGTLKINDSSPSNSLTIFADSIKMMHINGHQTYTFPVKHGTSNDISFQNLVVDVVGSNVGAFLVTYTPDSTYLHHYLKDKNQRFSGKVHLAKFDLYGSAGNGLQIFSNKVKNNEILACESVIIYSGSVAVLCTGGGHMPGDPSCTCGVTVFSCSPGYYLNYTFAINVCYEINIGGGYGGNNPSPGDDNNNNGGGTPPTTPPDYNPCNDGGAPTATGLKIQQTRNCNPPQPTPDPITEPPAPINPLDTISDASIRTNAKADCIYQSLKSNSIFKGLINAFVGSKTYNLSFKLDTMTNADNGQTTFNANYTSGDVVITLNKDKIDNRPAYDVARTYLHEAYHAYITQILIQNGGPFGIFVSRNDFNKDLNEIFDAYINYGVDVKATDANNRGVVFDPNAAEHELIASEIDKLALGMRQYVESKNPTIANDPSITLDNYRAAAWSGLTKTNAFKNKWGTTTNPTLISLIQTLANKTDYGCQ